MEELVSLLPDTNVLPVVQPDKTGEKCGAERLRGLSRKKRRQVVNADDAQRQVIGFGRELDRNSWLVESGVDVVDRNWIVRVGGIAGHIADNTQLPAWGSERRLIDKRWNLR